jgi:hypothetical protein
MRMMRITSLYYPTINIPNSQWLKQAILYTDSVASIVPEELIENYQFNPDISILKSEGVYREINPEILSANPRLLSLDNEFKELIESPEFQFLLRGRERIIDSRVHYRKISPDLSSYLMSKGLVRPGEHGWLKFERNTALLYMSILAYHCAQIDSERSSGLTIPSSDNKKYRDLVFGKTENSMGVLSTQIRIENLLPTPSADVPIDRILDFKQNHRSELLNLQNRIDHFSNLISHADSHDEANRIGAGFGMEIKQNLSGIEDYLKDYRLSTIKGSLDILIDAKRPELFGVIPLAALGLIPPIIEYIVTSGIRILSYYYNQRREKDIKIKSNPYSYLYKAGQKGIINPTN